MLIIARKPGEAKVGRVGNSLASWAAHQTHNLWQDVGRPGGEAGGSLCGLRCLSLVPFGLWPLLHLQLQHVPPTSPGSN